MCADGNTGVSRQNSAGETLENGGLSSVDYPGIITDSLKNWGKGVSQLRDYREDMIFISL